MEDFPEGTVWLVGAGPGDPELLTRKGERLIRAASVLFYDALVGPEVLALARPGAKESRETRQHSVFGGFWRTSPKPKCWGRPAGRGRRFCRLDQIGPPRAAAGCRGGPGATSRSCGDESSLLQRGGGD